MKLIDLHKRWAKKGRLPDYGLCHTFYNIPKEYAPLFDLFRPTGEERMALELEGKTSLYWASGSEERLYKKYVPMRQTIVLLICAMNNEL